MKVLALFFTCAALPLALQSVVDAQSRFNSAPQQNTEMRFRAMDQNNDGVVTRAEWRGSAQSFDEHDWNNDGILSGDEVRTGVPRDTRRLDQSDFDPASDRFFSWTETDFTTLDRNRDGRIVETEWQYDFASFRRVDRNGDGALSRAEFLGPTSNADRFSRIDFDSDGRIEINEWRWSQRSFEQRDANGDGSITRSELAANPAPGAGPRAPGAGPRAVATSGSIVRVDPKLRWTDTGIDVRAGDRISFDAEGTMELSIGGDDVSTPAGARSGRRAPDAPLRQEVAGGLMARIGNNSTPLFIGAQRTINRAPVSGRLYLGVNDDHLDDNSGEYRVSVTVQQR